MDPLKKLCIQIDMEIGDNYRCVRVCECVRTWVQIYVF